MPYMQGIFAKRGGLFVKMQGKIVKTQGDFGKNLWENQHKQMGYLWFSLAPVIRALTNDKYFMEKYVYARV